MTGKRSTIGFGSVEQRPNERSREDVTQYDLVTNVNLGQLLPKIKGIFHSILELEKKLLLQSLISSLKILSFRTALMLQPAKKKRKLYLNNLRITQNVKV